MFMRKCLKILSLVLITLIFGVILIGCYQAQKTLPPDIFLQVKEVDKPTINSLDDIQKSYIKLFEAYQLNLNLLKTIKNAQEN